jgi:hypothetical protein
LKRLETIITFNLNINTTVTFLLDSFDAAGLDLLPIVIVGTVSGVSDPMALLVLT